MNPSEANVFSSGISGFLSSKKRKDASYSRLNQIDDGSVEFSKVQFQKDHTSFCAKLCFTLLALVLLFATVATAVFIMNLKNFTVDVQLEKGNVRVYRFDQELTITGNEITARNMSIIVSMHVINRTESDCWFGIVLSFPEDAKNSLHSKEFAFLTRVTSAELGDFQDGPQNHFKVFGHRKTSHKLSFYVHNVLHQLLPLIKVKLYEFVLSKVSSSTRRTTVEKHGFLPGRVQLKRTMMTKRDLVTVTTQAKPDDFESFSSSEKLGKSTNEETSWSLAYDETTVVNKKTGMVKRSDMSLSCNLPIGSEFAPERGSNHQGLTVTFRSIVKLLDESPAKVKTWKTVLREEKDMNHPLDLPDTKDSSSLKYFASSKHNSNKGLADELKQLIKLSKNTADRSTKLPPMINIIRHNIPKSVKAEESDTDDNNNDDYMNFEHEDEDSDNGDDKNYDDDDDDENDNDDDSNAPYWPQPNYAPFGIGYEVKRKRSVETETRRPHLIKKRKAVKTSQSESKTPELDVIWDELTSSAPTPIHEAPRVIQTSILGQDLRAEIDYEVQANDVDDNDDDSDNADDEDWSVTTGYRITFGQYRITPFNRVHSLGKLKSKLPHKGQRKSSRWTVKAGDFVS